MIKETKYHSFEAAICIEGRRTRACFKTEVEACEWIDQQCFEIRKLTTENYHDALTALGILPERVTLTEAARFWAEAHSAEDPTITEALRRWIVAKRKTCRPTTLRQYEEASSWILNNITVTGLGSESTVAEVTPQKLELLLSGKTSSSRNLYMRTISSLYTWLIRTGAAKDNPVKRMDFARVERPLRSILTVGQAERILRTAEKISAGLTAYIAVGMFAGIRPYEMHRLSSEMIRDRYIILDAASTKTASERTIPIRPNLRKWLDRYLPKGEEIITPFYGLPDGTLRRYLRKAWLSVNLGSKPVQDILRHSYASYAYEQSNDAATTAAELGHVDTAMLFRHYRGLALPGSGDRYFDIFPTSSP